MRQCKCMCESPAMAEARRIRDIEEGRLRAGFILAVFALVGVVQGGVWAWNNVPGYIGNLIG